MIKNSFLQIAAIGSLALSILFLSGCAVGNAISDGYENFVTYFNAYYNAQRLFNEAEDEITTASKEARGKSVVAGQQEEIPGTAKQKLTQVIDKCSNILAFHSTSSLVDDALLMTGKSLFYTGDYRKAERKFNELIDQYPGSSLVLETKLWLAKTKDKLRNLDDAIRVAEALYGEAKEKNDKEIQAEDARLLAYLYQKNGMHHESEEYYDQSLQFGSGDEKAQAEQELGNVYFSEGNYEQAVNAYLKVSKFTSDDYMVYYCNLQTAIAYRNMKQFDESEHLLTTMIEDFHNKAYRPVIHLERAATYAANGKLTEATNEYYIVDTTYARTDHACRAARELGMLYEREKSIRDYKLALKYYSEASLSAKEENLPAKKKALALTRYYASYQSFYLADSLKELLADTSTQVLRDSLAKLTADSLSRKENDTTIRKLQSAILMKKSLPSLDSLMVLKSIAAHELGDVFYSDIEDPDSAITWYTKALQYHYDPLRSPRVLYILAELSRTPIGRKYSTPDEYYKRLNHDFPNSHYAEEARRLLGDAAVSTSDTAAERYQQAERMIDTKQYEQARVLLASIPTQFPASYLAPKSDYAVAWVWEYGLSNNDSALVQYRRVAKKYPGTQFALAALKRIYEPADTTKKDSVALHAPVPQLPPGPPLGREPDRHPAVPDSTGQIRPPMQDDSRKPRRPAKDVDDK